MPLLARKGTFVANTATGNQAVSFTPDGDSFTPKALILWAVQRTAVGYGAGLGYFIGAATSPTQRWAVCGFSDDAAPTSNTGRDNTGTACIYLLATGTPTVDAKADLVSLDLDGFTINWSNAPASAWIIHYLALGGDSITNAKAGVFTPPAAPGSQSITDPGFQPDFLMFAGVLSAADFLGINANLTLGVVSSPTQRGAASWRDSDADANMDVASSQRTDLAYMGLSSTAASLAHSADLTSFDATGWTLNFSASTANPVRYLALKGGEYYVGAETQRTSVGVKATAGLGFAPAALFGFGWNLAANAAVDATVAKLSIGGASAPGVEGGTWIQSVDAATTSDVDSRTVTDKFLGFSSQPSTTDAEADLASLDADGFTLDWTTADGTARQFVYAAFGPRDPTPAPLPVLSRQAAHRSHSY